mgnify:CR=1 FL=1
MVNDGEVPTTRCGTTIDAVYYTHLRAHEQDAELPLMQYFIDTLID